MTDDSRMLLSLLSKSLFSRDVDTDLSCDWKKVFSEAVNHSVALVCREALDASFVPEEAVKTWNRYSKQVLVNNVKGISNHVYLDQWMRAAGIPYVILKGCASAHYYPNHMLRCMGDVDFIVPREYSERAKQVLTEKGLKPDDDYYAHASFYNESTKSEYELHYTVAGIPEGRAGDRVREYIEHIYDDKKEINVEFGRVTVPSDFVHGLILLVHTACHLMGVGIGIRHLCDWAVFAESFSEEQFRSIFEKRLSEVGLWRFARIMTKVSVKYLGASPKRFCEDIEDDIADKLIADIIDSGNFGVKKEDKDVQLLYITSLKSFSFKRKTPFGQYMESYRDIIYDMWPVTKKAPILLPAGWMFADLSNLWNVVRGKKKLYSIRKVVKAARPRRELYKRFGLYAVSDV